MKSTIGWALPALLVFSTLAAQPTYAESTNPATISVTGIGSVNVAPDMANVTFGILREDKTARGALDKNNNAMADVLKELKAKGIAEKDIQTSQFNIQPKYVYPKPSPNGESQAPRIVGYTVSNSVAIRVRDLSQTGKILDQVVSFGVNNDGSIDFTNNDTTSILRLARENAVKDAIDKAKTLASAAGIELGSILRISEGSSRQNPRPLLRMQQASARVAESAVPIAAGEETYNVQVQMDWEIDQ